ncbi:ABC transporter permease [Tautonia plasticadhaerens]|uniref:ABC-2 family transporter protein n=1 Tax=Tautonia plasticadhaerens TaxID=2527974 RepID=A0A518HCK4_9BACT|nr:ABC transporter permease [Tautonia plasticadhaerens]QDV38577.1 ABC-2 family transporter protein [Tautonia plasticadhaerens]
MSALSLFLLLCWAQTGDQAPEASSPDPAASPSPQPAAAAPVALDTPAAAAPGGAPAPAAGGGDAAPPPAGGPVVQQSAVMAEQLAPWQSWVLLIGDPIRTAPVWWGPILSWIKIISLAGLLGWVGAWAVSSLRGRRPASFTVGGARPLDAALLLAIIVGIGCVFVRVAQGSGQMPEAYVLGVAVASLVGMICLLVGLAWLEVLLWSGIRRERRTGDLVVLLGIHLALLAAVGLSASLPASAIPYLAAGLGFPPDTAVVTPDGGLTSAGTVALVLTSVRMALTFMGFAVLARIAQLVIREVASVRPRRLYAMGKFSWVESFRKTRIPWAVLAIFLLILAFTHWFLQPPDSQREAELSRLYVGTLMLLSSILLTLMVAILTPITLPNDIRFQTIYTVVTKPVRRLEVVWGRMLGFMAVVTVLILALGGISLIYLDRNVGGRVDELREELAAAREAGLTNKAEQLEAQLDQLQTRMSARLPVDGSLTFIDSVGEPRIKGIDVGQELEIRSFVEGATQAEASWLFGPIVPHPVDRLFPNRPGLPFPMVSKPIPVDLLLERGTIEYLANEIYELAYQKAEEEAGKQGAEPGELSRINARVARLDEQIGGLAAQHQEMVGRYVELTDRAAAAEDEAEAARLRAEADDLRSPDVPVQMTFTVYRTTKGRPGEPVYASIQVAHPFSTEAPMFPSDPRPQPLLIDPLASQFGGGPNPLVGDLVYSDTFDVKEYYTNKWSFPAQKLVGSQGYLTIQVQCLSPTQYLGMAEGDLFVVASQGSFLVNYMRGLAGIWLQAMVLTAIGVWAGTFLSWPVALLITVFFFAAGEIFFPILNQLATGQMVGGGPFESMIRMISHQNQMSELDATLGVILAKSLDSIVVPIMSLLIFIVPNFSAMDLSNLVADGFAIRWSTLGANVLLALAYALPFSIAGYFILKNREVAA